jgi:hypothetical protein
MTMLMKNHLSKVLTVFSITFLISAICLGTFTKSVQSFLQYPIIDANPTQTIVGNTAVVNATIFVTPG